MTVAQGITDEIRRSPVTVIATVAGVVVSSLALLVAWLQYAGAPAMPPAPAMAVAVKLHVTNLLVGISFFLAASLSLASCIRLLARVHWFAALVLSVPAAVLAGFGTMVVVHLVPPRALDADALALAQDTVFYGTAFIFVAVNGLPVMRDLATPRQNEKSKPSDGTEGIGILGLGIVLLLIWGGFVSAGIAKLSRMFLG